MGYKLSLISILKNLVSKMAMYTNFTHLLFLLKKISFLLMECLLIDTKNSYNNGNIWNL